MPKAGSRQDHDHFDDWENFDMDDDIYAGVETDVLDDWEDDGSIAEIRETPVMPVPKVDDIEKTPVQLDEESAEVFSLIERAQSKRTARLEGITGPSEDELSKIENIGIDEYIDEVLNEESDVILSEEKKLDPSAKLKDDQVDGEEPDVILSEAKNLIPSMSFGDETENVDLIVQPLFEGVGCCLPTFFDEDGEAEYKTTARLAKRLSNTHAAAIFVATPSGEGQTLTVDEHKKLVKEVAKVLPETFVIADVSAPSTRQTLELATNAVQAKADALIVELSSKVRDPYALCEAIHNKNYDTPLLVRLVGDPQDLPITPEFLFDLPITGVIDETGDASFLLNLASVYTGPIYVGSIATILLGSALNLAGAVNSAACIADDLVANAFAGDVDAQLQLAGDERDFGGFSPQRIKQALEANELVTSTTRD